MKSRLLIIALLLTAIRFAHGNPQAQNTVDAYFNAIRNEEYVRVAEMIAPAELERFKSIWTAFAIASTNIPNAAEIMEPYLQGQSIRQLEAIPAKDALARFLQFATNHADAKEAFQPPSKYKIHRYLEGADMPSLIINYDTDERNVDMEYRFDTSDGSWKLFLPDPILHAVNKIAKSVRAMN